MSQSRKLVPNLDQQSSKILNLNLTVLQRIDPFIEDILLTVAHVTFYEFNIENNEWSRKDVEGSLFVVKRNTHPRFQFIVMNRRNTDNLVETVMGDFEFEVQLPYLLYRNASQEVNGIWFYNSSECEELASLFNRILSAFSKVPSKPRIFSSKSAFEELEAVPSMAIMEGPLEPTSTSSTATDIPEDLAFVNFFSMAMNMSSIASNGANAKQTYHQACTNIPLPSPIPIMQIPSYPPSAPSTPSVHHYDTPDTMGNSNRVANLLNPSPFFSPPSSSSAFMRPPVSSYIPTTLPPSLNLQHPYTPMLQSFPPSTPPMSLTSSPVPSSNTGPVISRDKVRDALVMLAQDNQFIDMVYHALMRAHHSMY